jgi:Domain of unknown function (DUF4331)
MKQIGKAASVLLTCALMFLSANAFGSSHMDAPLITLDDAANTTDVYAFLTSRAGAKYLTVALAVWPFEEPGIGPNAFRFDDNVLYQLHVATGDDLAAGRPSFTYQFRFRTEFRNAQTTLQTFLGPINQAGDSNQNLFQSYEVTKVVERGQGRSKGNGFGVLLGEGRVPPNNQGLVTFKYNTGNNGESRAKEGVSTEAELDDYTRASIATLKDGYRSFAGQRDDGFYADIQSIFDLDLTFGGPNKPFDSQGGFNVHTMVLEIPLSDIGGDHQVVGVYATTSRKTFSIDKDDDDHGRQNGRFVQVGRQGNPLFNEGLVAVQDKDRYNQTEPTVDRQVFQRYALNPELAALLAPLLGLPADRLTNRTDIAGIFIPDLIKVDLSTQPARLAGNPDDAGFHRLSIFGGDVLQSQIQPGFGNGIVPGGWPNGRRFGDDVVDIAVIALASDLRTSPPTIFGAPNTASLDIDKVTKNDITYNKVMPYAATPLNGRNHPHHGQ